MDGRRAVLALVLASVVVAGGCSHRARSPRPAAGSATTATSAAAPTTAGDPGLVDVPAIDVPAADHPRGGSAAVGVWEEPDPAAPTMAGSAVRALVLPQLFVARPDGRWSSGLAAPGSDRLAGDHLSATFRLRPGATWSDGTPITVADLQRSADVRFVQAVEGPAGDGTITVRFAHPLVNWRRLWSGHDSISAPADGVWGGPFVVAARTPGLETVLRRNDRWWGARPAFLDEVHLVLVPDATTARQLLGAGRLDVVMPLAGTARTPQIQATPGVTVSRDAGATGPMGGWSVVLLANPAKLSEGERRALLASVDRTRFVSTLLAGEATRFDGETGAWKDAGLGPLDALKGETVDLVGSIVEPMTTLLHRSMQKRVRAAGGTIELRAAAADRVEGWLRDGSYGAAVAVRYDPLGGCWPCRAAAAGDAEVLAADGGDAAAAAAIEKKERDDLAVLPLWRPDAVVAVRNGLDGPAANRYAVGPAWNAWEWWRPAGGTG
jgi:ABC-type transport system substrate-binding protein